MPALLHPSNPIHPSVQQRTNRLVATQWVEAVRHKGLPSRFLRTSERCRRRTTDNLEPARSCASSYQRGWTRPRTWRIARLILLLSEHLWLFWLHRHWIAEQVFRTAVRRVRFT